MSKVTGIVIAKNEEDMIGECLDSLSFCDQIIVVDTGSTDATSEIAKKKGAKVFDFVSDNFSKIREFGASKARSSWILYVDADERVSKNLQKEIEEVIEKTKSEFSAYRVTRRNFYLGKHEWPMSEKLERLFKRSALIGWEGELHESARVNGKVGDLTGELFHYTHRTLSSMVEKTNIWSEKEARFRFKASHPQMSWWRFPRVMGTAWYDSYIKQSGWKAGTMGIVESIYQMFSMFITYAKLWEMQQKKK